MFSTTNKNAVKKNNFLSLSFRNSNQDFPQIEKVLKIIVLLRDWKNSDGYSDPDAEEEEEESDSESLIIICWWKCWWWILLAWIISCHQHSHLVSSSILTADYPHSISYSCITLHLFIIYYTFFSFNG